MSVIRVTSRLPGCCACPHCCEIAHVSDSSGPFEFSSLHKCGFLGAFAKSRKAPVGVIMSVRPSLFILSAPTGLFFFNLILGCLTNAFRETAGLVRIERRHRVCMYIVMAGYGLFSPVPFLAPSTP